MKKAILHFIGLVLGNYLSIKYAFVQDNMRFIGLFGFILGLISIFNFSAKFAGLFIKRDFSFNEITSANAAKDKSLNKPASITLIMLVLLIGFHVWGYISFFKYQDELLVKNGIPAKAVITDKKWEKRIKNSPAEYYVYYEFKYHGKTFRHSYPNELKEIGDSLVIKLLPENPDNHIVVTN